MRQQGRSTTARERQGASTDPACSIAERDDIARRALRLAGRFRSGHRDLAESHDQHLDEAFD